MSISVRPARTTDNADIARLTTQLGYDVETPAMAQRLSRILPRADQQLLVAELDGSPVGWLHATIREYLESNAYVEISGLVVDRDHRGKGIGRTLMEHAESWARDRGFSLVRLRSTSTRTQAHRFYEGLGYVNVKTQYSFAKSLDPSRQDVLNKLVPRVER